VRAVVYERFGPPEVLRVVEVPRPVPDPHEVLVRIHATTVTAAESAMRRGRPLWGRVIIGLFSPRRSMRTLGIELAGVVEDVGAGVTRFRPGDEVFGFAGFAIGANAEYMRLSERASLAKKPTRATFVQAAAVVDGASTALYFLRDKAKLQAGQRVLVVGASGSIGTYAVQLAKHFGAEVTGVCSGANVELVRELGATDVIDYTREDFTRRDETWDVVFDTVGVGSFGRCRRVLTPRGCYVVTTGLHNYLLEAWTRIRGGKRVITGMSVDKTEALPLIAKLVDDGTLRIVIDRVYDLDEIVQAHRYVDSGRKRGNVVVEVRADTQPDVLDPAGSPPPSR
jgi:NADPH:quinone reductase-like Zn-dependent oxidoreductase